MSGKVKGIAGDGVGGVCGGKALCLAAHFGKAGPVGKKACNPCGEGRGIGGGLGKADAAASGFQLT